MGLCAQNQTCTNFGFPSNALEYVLLDGIWLESKTSWTKNAQTVVTLERHPHILIGAQTKAPACYSRKVLQSFLHGCIKTIDIDPELAYWIEKNTLLRHQILCLVGHGGRVRLPGCLVGGG